MLPRLGVTHRPELERFEQLIASLRRGADGYTAQGRGRTNTFNGDDSDNDRQMLAAAGSRTVRAPRTTSLYSQANGSSSGIPRTIGRQGLPPAGNAAIGGMRRRTTLTPGQGMFGRGDETPRAPRRVAGAAPATVGRVQTHASLTDILERSSSFAAGQRAGDSDEDLEHVVRQSGRGGLVNAYGIPTRPTTAGRRTSMIGRPRTARRESGAVSREQTVSNLHDKIRVCVRKRPLSSRERERGEKDVAVVRGRRGMSVMEPKVKVDMTRYIEESRFLFDEVFSETATNGDVYERTAKPLVEYVFGGGNATCFAYGQTGSGKTYTMLDVQDGLYIRAAEDLFALLARPEHGHLQAFVTFYEIYLVDLYDLLNDRKKLFAREDAKQNVVVQNVREVLVQSPEDLMSVFEYGNGCRSTGSTGANADSSRSHAILQISLKDVSGRRPVMHGKLSFIDLAGNERGSDRGDRVDKRTLKEGSEINKSLLALKECIRALDLNKAHQPFRGSKLTQVLKDSFIGNSRACMVATISPNSANCDNTLNTLRYADRVKAMKGASSSAATADVDSPINETIPEGDYYGADPDGYEDDSAERAEEWNMQDDDGDDDEFMQTDSVEGSIERMDCAPRESFGDVGAMSEDAPSILDEQPAFAEDVRMAPRAYGSPAAKGYVATRLPKSPVAARSKGSRLSSILARTRSTAPPEEPPRSAYARVRPPPSPAIEEHRPRNGQVVSPVYSSSATGGVGSSSAGHSPPPSSSDGQAAFAGLRLADVDAFVKHHRAEIRATTEACKEETTLISAYTALSYAQLAQNARGEAAQVRAMSWQQSLSDKYHLDVASGRVTRLQDAVVFDTVEDAKMHEAMEYLEHLDEVLERKQQSVVNLRNEIRNIVWSRER
ncbi:kinesin-domain-containing protein [Linderina pennispora]|uniref:Kinesin-like protein n=1 Tax=Linderina pennispora TaxID=61395 RepID=A0A1Y1WFS3_9FUNG|nr:kinesin-domain-containing protein [Linderina pennispora]ORX72332.1 kinesin-domain-containing protein [Linderina pennispora]